MKKIHYKELILQALAEHADLTVSSLLDFLEAMAVSKSESSRMLSRMMRPSDTPRHRVKFFSGLVSENAARVTLSRLKKEGLVASEGGGKWSLVRQKNTAGAEARKASVKKEILVSFDIPELEKTSREWLRAKLKTYGFYFLQKSVWVGSNSLPKEFLKEIRSRGLEDAVCIVGIRTPGTIKDLLEA